MNDSLLDELEQTEPDDVNVHYQPLLGGRVRNSKPGIYSGMKHRAAEKDVWSELHEDPGTVSNLDAFFVNLYNFYYHKGLLSIIVSGLVNIINLFFTIFLSTFLLGCIDWGFLKDCHSEASCESFSKYVSCGATWGMFKVMIFFYCFLFSIYWVWMLLKYIQTVKDAMETHIFYRDRLKISTRELQILDWDTVVNKVLQLNVSNRKISAHDIASRVMRKENYLIALFNKKVLGLESDLPDFFCSRFGISNFHWNFFTKNMEWNIQFCVLDHMFSDQFIVRRKFLMDAEGLKKRFIIAGIANFFMVPFVLLFMIMHFFLKYTQEWHTQRNYLGPRQWSPYALWKFREFNELQHVFDNRIANTYTYAQQYQSLFPARVASVVARGVSFIAGSLLAVLFLFSLYDEDILFHVRINNRQLLWYFTILAAIFALARSFVPTMQENFADAEETMLKLAAHTHYIPSHWKGKCHTFDVRDEFFSLFQYKAKLFFMECVSVVITPYILCFCLPKRSESILEFIQNYTVNIDGIGSVCRYALFDFKTLGNSKYGCPGASSDANPSYDGKMEKSFINFKENHPTWKGSLEGENMFNRIGQYKGEQEAVALEKSLASINLQSHIGNSGFFNNENIGEQQDGNLEPSASMFGSNSISISQQLLQSQAIQAVLGKTQHENHFYWLEKYYQAQMEAAEESLESGSTRREV